MNGFGFGTAIDYLKQGKKVARNGWNGNLPPPNIPMAPTYEPKDRVEYVEEYDLTYIRLSDGKVAVCDGSEYEKVREHKWTSYKGKYAFYTNNSEKESIRLHNFIFGTLSDGYIIDHINGNGLDCRSINMRIATYKDNSVNRTSRQHSSIYKGVSWDNSRNKWIASIQTNGKTLHIGRYDNEEEAAKAYDRKAWELFGQFAKLNFIDEKLVPRMFLYYVPAASYAPCTDIAREAFGGNDVPYGAYIAMKTAQNNVVPWLASQTDMLAEDWIVVE